MAANKAVLCLCMYATLVDFDINIALAGARTGHDLASETWKGCLIAQREKSASII